MDNKKIEMVLSAVEFGFKNCEWGNNLEKTLEYAKRILANPDEQYNIIDEIVEKKKNE